MNISEFKRIVFHVAEEIEVRIEEIFEPSITPNFFAAELRKNGLGIFILCTYKNEWAFSKNYEKGTCQLEFTDFKDFSRFLEHQFGYRPYSAEELNASFEPKEYMLDSDIKYWRPKSLGEGLFNWWD